MMSQSALARFLCASVRGDETKHASTHAYACEYVIKEKALENYTFYYHIKSKRKCIVFRKSQSLSHQKEVRS